MIQPQLEQAPPSEEIGAVKEHHYLRNAGLVVAGVAMGTLTKVAYENINIGDITSDITPTEHLGVAGAVTGFVIGSVLESRGQRKIGKQRLALAETFGDDIILPKPRRRNTALRLAGAGVAMGVTLGANGMAWETAPEEAGILPGIGIVADFSGATGVGAIGERPVDSTNTVLNLFQEGNKDDFTTTVFVARADRIAVATLDEAALSVPFGNAPVADGVRTAFDAISLRTQQAEANETEQTKQVEDAIVVITNGNSIGSVKKTINEATQDGNKVKVNVVNVEAVPDPEVIADFQKIAEATGGQYLTAKDATQESIEQMVADITPDPTEPKPAHGWTDRLLMATFGTGAILAWRRNRKNAPLTYDGLSDLTINKETK